MNEQEKEKIINVLCSLALSDHLGDVRDAEFELWELIGVPSEKISNDTTDAWTNTRTTLIRNGLNIPEYLKHNESDEEYDDDDDNEPFVPSPELQ